ncbi:MAG: gliding motility-associated C-terminal domain-containing protein [Bacteroidota bacterium]
MNIYKTLFFISVAFVAKAQVQLTPVVVGSTGTFSEPSFGSVTSTVGEPITTTLSANNKHLTQGFNQPNNTLKFTITGVNATCFGGENGSAFVEITSGKEPFTVEWLPTNQKADTAIGLREGKHVVVVTDANGRTKRDSVEILADSPVPCEIKIYSGFSPNGDGANENWAIDNILLYPDNSVKIFTRWGEKIWDATNYDNSTVVWDGKSNLGTNLPEGTYFYMVEINKTKYEGWVQLSR